MTAQTATSARTTWRAQIEDLERRIAEAEQGVTDARNAASTAALEGGDLDSATRELALARDRHDALRTAKAEAERHLAHAEADHAQRERDRALARAQNFARKRIETASELDAYLTALDPLVARWRDLGAQIARELHAAGVRAPGGEGAAYRLRAGAWDRAPLFMQTIEAPRVSLDHRVPVRDITAAQAAPYLAKGE